MKLVCDCGNEMEFIPDADVETEDEEEEMDDEYGQYVKKDYAKFDFWAEHDQAGITCQKCKTAIWYFA